MSGLGKETNDALESLERLAREKVSLNVISEEAARARIVVQHLRAWEQVRSLESEKASLEAVLAGLHRRLYDYATTDADLKEVASRLEETKEEIALHRQTERELLGDESRLKTELEHCVDAERRASEAGEKLAEVDARITVCEVLSDAYERVPFYILDNVLPIMEDEANKVLEEISDSGMRIELRTERPNKTNANVDDTLLDIIVSDMAGERPIELYSGGEKTRQILALAVGLAELSARKAGVKIETILIDEPAGLDEQGLLDFGRCFIRLVEAGVFKKGLLMAHEDVLKNVFDQRILVSKRGTASEIEIVTS
jgi:exonuclease SbcC